MENRINVADLLKYCPKGMELDCTMFDNVKFISVEVDNKPICIRTGDIYRYLTKFGTWTLDENAKCVIFPKGKTTWDGFVTPCNFNDGDIVATENGLFIGIVKVINNIQVNAYCAINKLGSLAMNTDCYFDRFATKEEKEKLFDAIKDNGYKWNTVTKTIERLSPSPKKFDISTLIPFESRVLVRDGKYNKWFPAVWGFYDNETSINFPYEVVGGSSFAFCIPYEGNESLLGTKDDCDEFFKTWE